MGKTRLQQPPVLEPLRLLLAVLVGERVRLALGLADAVVVDVGLRVAVGVFDSFQVAVFEAVGLELRVTVRLMLTGGDGGRGGEWGTAKQTNFMHFDPRNPSPYLGQCTVQRLAMGSKRQQCPDGFQTSPWWAHTMKRRLETAL